MVALSLVIFPRICQLSQIKELILFHICMVSLRVNVELSTFSDLLILTVITQLPLFYWTIGRFVVFVIIVFSVVFSYLIVSVPLFSGIDAFEAMVIQRLHGVIDIFDVKLLSGDWLKNIWVECFMVAIALNHLVVLIRAKFNPRHYFYS